MTAVEQKRPVKSKRMSLHFQDLGTALESHLGYGGKFGQAQRREWRPRWRVREFTELPCIRRRAQTNVGPGRLCASKDEESGGQQDLRLESSRARLRNTKFC